MEIRNKDPFRKYARIICLTLGMAFMALGFTLLIQFNVMYDYMIAKAMEFTPSSESFKAWKFNDPPLKMHIYFFNWTNTADIWEPNVKPRFEQIGPYVIEETKEKVNITWHSNGTISYRYIKRYYFLEKESPRKLKDEIRTINHVALVSAYKLRNESGFSKNVALLSMMLLSSLFITRTAGELLFDGYVDHMLNVGRIIDPTLPKRFGFFYNRNGSLSTEELEMHTVVDANFGKIKTLNRGTKTNYFPGKCGEVHGSGGEFYPMNAKPTHVDIFNSELCGTATLEYERNVTVKGVLGFKYGSKNLFDNGTIRPENACFCNGECLPSGTRNVSSCRLNAPIFLSLPHFYNADPYYRSLIDGMHPEKDKHELYITLEPKSSILIDSALRAQVNMLLQPLKGIGMYSDVPRVFIPLFYYDQNVTMTDELAVKLKEVLDLPDLAKKASIGMIISGGVVIGISILMYVFIRKKDEPSIKKIGKFVEDIPLRSDS